MLAQLHIASDEYEQALVALDEAGKFGFDVEGSDLRATAQAALGNRDAAGATLEELARLRPDLQWPRDRSAALNAKGGRPPGE